MLESEKKTISSTGMYTYKYCLPILEGLSGTRYAARQIKGELIPVHDGEQYRDDLNLHDTIIVSVYHDKR